MKFKITLVLFAALLSSCASRTYNVTLQNVDVDSIVSEVKANHESFSSIRALANISILNDGENIKFRQVTVAKKDNMLRIEALAIFGAVIAQIFSDSEKVYLSTRYEQVVFDNTSDFKFAFLYPDIPQELGVGELVNILLANPPVDIWQSKYSVDFDGNSKKMIVSFDNPEEVQIEINPEKKVMEKISYLLSSGVKAEIVYSDFKKVSESKFFPKRIQLISEQYNLSVVYNNDFEINPVLDISIFRPGV